MCKWKFNFCTDAKSLGKLSCMLIILKENEKEEKAVSLRTHLKRNTLARPRTSYILKPKKKISNLNTSEICNSLNVTKESWFEHRRFTVLNPKIKLMPSGKSYAEMSTEAMTRPESGNFI